MHVYAFFLLACGSSAIAAVGYSGDHFAADDVAPEPSESTMSRALTVFTPPGGFTYCSGDSGVTGRRVQTPGTYKKTWSCARVGGFPAGSRTQITADFNYYSYQSYGWDKMSIFITDGADCEKSPYDSSFSRYVSKVNYKGPQVALEAPCNDTPCCVITVCQNTNDMDCSTSWKWEVYRPPFPSQTPSTTPSFVPGPSNTGSNTGTDSATPSPGSSASSSPTPSPTGTVASASGSSSSSSTPLPGGEKSNGGDNGSLDGAIGPSQAPSSSQEDGKNALILGVSVGVSVVVLLLVAGVAVVIYRRSIKSTPALSGNGGATTTPWVLAPGAGSAGQQSLPPSMHIVPMNNPLRM